MLSFAHGLLSSAFGAYLPCRGEQRGMDGARGGVEREREREGERERERERENQKIYI
jgi:hypothetical protein